MDPTQAFQTSDSLAQLLHPTAPFASSSAVASATHNGLNSGERSYFAKDDVLPSFDFQSTGSASPKAPGAWEDNHALSGSRAVQPPHPSSGYSFEGKVYPCGESSQTFELAKSKQEDRGLYDSVAVAAVERTMKKYADNILSVLEGMSGRFSQLESITHRLELSIDGLRVIETDNRGEIDSRLKKLENLIKEVQMGIHILHDKQEVAEAQSQISKLQLLKASSSGNLPPIEQHREQAEAAAPPSSPSPSPSPSPVAVPHQHQFAPSSATSHALPSHLLQQQSPQLPTPPQQSLPYPIPPSMPNEPAHYPAQHQPPPSYTVQQHPATPPHMQQPAPSPPHSMQMPSFYSQQTQSQHALQPSYGQQVENPPYLAPPTPSGSYVPDFSSSIPGNYGASPPRPLTPSQQYGPGGPQPYELSLMRTGSNVMPPATFQPQGQQVPYETQSGGFGSPSYKVAQPVPSAPTGIGGYPRLPTAQPIHHALPTSVANTGGASGGAPLSTTRVPIDEVIEKVATMGFSRDQVRAVVRRLTENGQSVDLNIVLDKLMNGGEGQAQKGWFAR